MASDLQAIVGVLIHGEYIGPQGINAPKQRIYIKRTIDLRYGTGDGKANQYLEKNLTAGAINQNVAVNTGTEQDCYNANITMTMVAAIVVCNENEVSGDAVDVAGSFFINAMGNITNIRVNPQGFFLAINPTQYVAGPSQNNIAYQRVGGNNVSTKLFVLGHI